MPTPQPFSVKKLRSSELQKNYKKEQEEVWKEYNEMRPVLTHANEIVTDLFNARKDQKQELQEVNTSLSELYAERNRLWELYRESKRENYIDYKAMRFVTGLLDGGPLMLPIFVLALTVKIIVDLTRDKDLQYAFSGCKDKIEDLNKEIDELKVRKFDILHEIKDNSEQIKDSIQFRDEIKANMAEIKSNIATRQKEVEERAAKPKVTAASLQKAFGKIQPGTIHYGLPPSALTFVIRQDITESSNIQELNLKLLKDDLHLTPVMNASGLVLDLKITQRGKDTLLSEVTDSQETIDTVMAWGRLTNMPTVQPRQEQTETQRVSQGRGYTHNRKEEPAEEESVTTGYKMHR